MTPRADEAAVLAIRPQLLELQLWHSCQEMRRGNQSLAFALTHWTGLTHFLLTDEALMTEVIASLTDHHDTTEDPDGFVLQAVHYLQPLLDQADARRILNNHTWHDCFRADLAADGVTTNLHFYNACCPASLFADMAARRAELRSCLTAIYEAHPAITHVRCASWVNNLAPFRSLFPPEFTTSLEKTDPDGKSGLGWWGQFITKENQLHPERVAELKTTGRFHYHRLAGICQRWPSSQ